jgi:AcrR family transcriptional regulator
MGIVERKEREKQEMRALIFKTAIQTFSEEGFENTSIRGIAKRIEYSPATIYLYFKDKNELLYAIHEEGFTTLLNKMRAVLTIANPLKRLREIGNIYIQFSIEHPEYYNLMFNLMKPMQVLEVEKPWEWESGKQAFAFLETVAQECLNQKLIKGTHAKSVAFYSWSFLHGLCTLHNSCRMRVMQLTETENKAMLYQAVKEWINMIKI